ncbi:MAG: hypothetical protein ACLUCH_08865 [Lachnospirales bacterium]
MNLSEAISIAKSKNYREMELIYDGIIEGNNNPRSYVYKIGNFCIKYYIKSKEIDFEKETSNLNKLKEYKFAPELYYSDENDYFIIMEYIYGVPLKNIDDLNENQKEQLKKIKCTLDKLGIFYEKEHEHCLAESNGNLRFIDFGL